MSAISAEPEASPQTAVHPAASLFMAISAVIAICGDWITSPFVALLDGAA